MYFSTFGMSMQLCDLLPGGYLPGKLREPGQVDGPSTHGEHVAASVEPGCLSDRELWFLSDGLPVLF